MGRYEFELKNDGPGQLKEGISRHFWPAIAIKYSV
jgi:hypothetical protein